MQNRCGDGVSVAEFVNVASEPMVHLIDRDAIPVLWRGEQGGSAGCWPAPADRICLNSGSGGCCGESFRSPGHPADTWELLYVTEGELTLTVNNDPYQVAEGCSAVARTDVPHEYCNFSQLPVVFTMTVYEKGR